MKKTMKVIFMAMVITVISLMATSAFAYEAGDKVLWETVYEDGETNYRWLDYAGEITEGENEMTANKDSVVYKFEVKESGYYFVCGGTYLTFGESDENDRVKNYAESRYMIGENETYGDLFYLEKGTIYASNHTIENTNVSIEYYGAIEDVVFEKTVFIKGEDAFVYEDGEIGLCCFDFTVEFSNGKELVDGYECTLCCSFYVELVDEFKEGENKVVFELPGYKETIILEICEITDFIESVELSNIGRYTTVYEDYSGENDYIEINGETLTVKFTDGTEYVANVEHSFAEIVLPNGKKVNAYMDQGSDDVLYITIANKCFAEIECKVEGKMLGENINILHENNMETLRWSMNSLKNGFRWLAEDTEWAMVNFRWSVDEFVQVFRNIVRFVNYYIALA